MRSMFTVNMLVVASAAVGLIAFAVFVNNSSSNSSGQQEPTTIIVKLVGGDSQTGSVDVRLTIGTITSDSSVFVNTGETDMLITVPPEADVDVPATLCARVLASDKTYCSVDFRIERNSVTTVPPIDLGGS